MSLLQLAIMAGGLLATLALFYSAFLGPNPGKEATRRLQALRIRHSQNETVQIETQFKKAVAQRKPKQYKVAGSGSRMEALQVRLGRTGKGWTTTGYFYACGIIAAIIAVLIAVKTHAFMLAIGAGLAGGIFFPHKWVSMTINRRLNKFVTRFPDALELLVRGLRSGLPVTETLGIVAQELPGPVGQEFKLVTDRIRVGRTMEEALQETADRLALTEFNFFCITLAIQRETGGNLAETLYNLADVLRKRAQTKLKVKAMSSESKASAYIIGVLPFMVFGLIYWINPGYMGRFFIDERLMVAGMGAMGWLALGAFIMSRMISFEI